MIKARVPVAWQNVLPVHHYKWDGISQGPAISGGPACCELQLHAKVGLQCFKHSEAIGWLPSTRCPLPAGVHLILCYLVLPLCIWDSSRPFSDLYSWTKRISQSNVQLCWSIVAWLELSAKVCTIVSLVYTFAHTLYVKMTSALQ